MDAYRPDRVVKVLSALATGLYYATWAVALLLLVWLPVAKLISGAHSDVFFRVGVPVDVVPPALALPAWRVPGAEVRVSQLQASASVPIASLSTGFVALVWTTLAVLLALVLLFLHHLRRLFQRVRSGAPFDPANAVRLRWLGLLLLGACLWEGVSQFWLALVIERMLEGPGDALGVHLDINLPTLLVALVLIALSQIFRRGSALEDEQSLVV